MKKIVMATLLMAMTGVASAQVTLSGKASMFVDRTDVNGTANTQMVTEPTSNVAISVSEKLGNGFTARAVVETSINGNTIDGVGTKLGDRQRTVGLDTPFGSVDLGRNVHGHFLAITTNDVFGTMYGSVAGDVHNLRGLRMSDGVFVRLSPVKAISVGVDRTQTAGPETTVYSLGTNLGPVSAVATQFEAGVEKTTVVGLGTKFKGTQLHYVFSDEKGAVEGKGHLVGAAQRIGAITAKASYGENDRDVKAYAVGADYHFSKRTELTLAYRNVDGATTDVKSVGLGLTHRF